MQPSFVAVVISVVSYFKFQALCTCVMLINHCLLNVAFSKTKALNNRICPKQNFHSLPPSKAILKTLLLLLLVFHFFIKFQLTTLQLEFRGLQAN